MLEVHQIKKSFGSLQAVDGVSFNVQQGEAVGFLGPNGAGKSTTLSITVGLLKATSGEVTWKGAPFGNNPDAIKRKIGFVPQDFALYEELSALSNLNIFGLLYGLSKQKLRQRAQDVMKFVGLQDRAKDVVKTYSGGMKRRLNLAVALLHEPELLILDEPTVGVDPQSRNAIFENVEMLKSQGISILYTTHYMEEVERLCSRVIIMDAGKVVEDGDLNTLRQKYTKGTSLHLASENDLPEGFFAELKTQLKVRITQQTPQAADIVLPDLYSVESVFGCARRHQIRMKHAEISTPRLEQIFLSLTGKTLRDA